MARVQAYARKVNLQAADVSNVTARTPEAETRQLTDTRAIPGCVGITLDGLHAIHSARFETAEGHGPPYESVRSTVEIATSAATANAVVAADKTARARRCIALLLRAGQESSGPLFRYSIHVYPHRDPLPGHKQAFAFSVNSRTVYLPASPGGHRTGLGNPPAITTDVTGFAVGAAQVTLFDAHEATRSTKAQEQRLLALLYRRATTHKL